MTTKTLRELAAAALAEKIAAMTPEQKADYDDPDGSKRRAAAEEAKHQHAWRMFEASPLYGWFPSVQWGVGDHPMYPPDSIVVYDTEERQTRESAYFLIEWHRDDDPDDPQFDITVRTTSMNHDTNTGYTYWSEGAYLRSAADVGDYLAKWYARR